ncbi:MAG TPA: Mur ligase family protein [Patescibacteria group bacterium]
MYNIHRLLMFKDLLVQSAKLISKTSKKLNLGAGSTWPGHIALKLNPNIISELLANSSTEVILIVGTNGKTTTSTILTTILKEDGKKVIQNTSGANLLNGIASSLLLSTNTKGQLNSDFAVFEVDENNLPIVLKYITPKEIIALNLFRDQLDRYGELDSIAKKWNRAFRHLNESTTLILNADDPLIAYLAKDAFAKVAYFGLSEKEVGTKILEHASDSIYCPNCGNKLKYTKIFFSHLGIWHCSSCGVKRPLPSISEVNSPLPGKYNLYNSLSAVLSAQVLGVKNEIIKSALEKVKPAFGRQEILNYKNKTVQIFLSKNPTSMNQSLSTITELGAKNVLFVLNDQIPDGRDVSWIWDIDFEKYIETFESIVISGDRTFDMALRLQYSSKGQNEKKKIQNYTKYQILNTKYFVASDLKTALDTAITELPQNETLYILPTYSAMLEVRKILTGRKIL